MKLFAIVAFGALVGAGSASAQTTRCQNTVYGMPQLGMTCETAGGGSAASEIQYDPAAVEPRPCSFNELHIKQIGDALCSARAVAAKRKTVGELIAQGRCQEATSAALQLGDLTYARQVRDFCVPKP